MTDPAEIAKGPITQEEMIEMFGEAMPIEAVRLIWHSPPHATIGEVRAELRRLAATLAKIDKALGEG